MIQNMEWYRTFYFTAKTGSFSKAAEKLFITQPAVSHSIKQLENALGSSLFIRTPQGVKLTAEGEVLFTYIEQAYSFVETAEKKIAKMHQLMIGEISFGASDTLCKHYLLPYLESFHQAYPDIQIKVKNGTTEKIVSVLKEGEIDFGIVNLPLKDKQLNIIEALQIQDCFVGGTQYNELALFPISLEKLLTYPMILLEKESNSRRYIDQFALERGQIIQPEFELGSIDLLVEFARIGLGISCVIKNWVKEELACSDLYEIQLEDSVPPRSIGIVTLKEIPLNTTARHFIDMLVKDKA